MEERQALRERIAADLLRIGAVFLRPEEPFTWASGIKSPIYCDNRLTLSDPAVRTDVESGLKTLIEDHFPATEMLMGTATAGIAHAAITAHLMGIPMGYVRSDSKDHGRKNRIEGRLEAGTKVTVVEDLISTGGSVIETVRVLREAGADVQGIVSIFTYGMQKSRNALEEADLINCSLTDFDTAVSIAAKQGLIAEDAVTKLMQFRDNPQDEAWIGAQNTDVEIQPERKRKNNQIR